MEVNGRPETTETRKFVLMFDKFFDILNVSSFVEGKRKRKPFREPFTNADDARLKVHVHELQGSTIHLSF